MSLTNLILQINLTASFYTSLNGKFWIQFVWIKFDDFVRKEVSSGNFVHWKLVQSQVLRHKSKPFIFKWKVQKLVSVKKEAVSCQLCRRADVSYFLCCNKGNRRRLHAGKVDKKLLLSLHSRVFEPFIWKWKVCFYDVRPVIEPVFSGQSYRCLLPSSRNRQILFRRIEFKTYH